jgi:hypothetical protein
VTELISFRAGDSEVIVELGENEPGLELVSRRDKLVGTAKQTLDSAFDVVRPAIESLAEQIRALDTPRLDQPTEICVEFGLRLNAEVGAVIAKTQTEGHLTVSLKWTRTNDRKDEAIDS